MTPLEISRRYARGLATQKRRLIIRSLMAGALISTALLDYLYSGLIGNAPLWLYALLLVYLVFSYGMGRRTGAVRDFRAIAEHYMRQDSALDGTGMAVTGNEKDDRDRAGPGSG